MVLLLSVLHCSALAACATLWCSCCLCHTVVLLLPVPYCGAPAACATLWCSHCLYHTVPHWSCYPHYATPLLLPVPHHTSPATCTVLHWSCCLCHIALVLLPAPCCCSSWIHTGLGMPNSSTTQHAQHHRAVSMQLSYCLDVLVSFAYGLVA